LDFILFYFILFYFILFYFILFYFILFYFILFYFILFYFLQSPKVYFSPIICYRLFHYQITSDPHTNHSMTVEKKPTQTITLKVLSLLLLLLLAFLPLT
jgi:hypothetical protein